VRLAKNADCRPKDKLSTFHDDSNTCTASRTYNPDQFRSQVFNNNEKAKKVKGDGNDLEPSYKILGIYDNNKPLRNNDTYQSNVFAQQNTRFTEDWHTEKSNKDSVKRKDFGKRLLQSHIFNEEGTGNPFATVSVRPGPQKARVNDTHKSNIFDMQNESREPKEKATNVEKLVRASKINRSNVFSWDTDK